MAEKLPTFHRLGEMLRLLFGRARELAGEGAREGATRARERWEEFQSRSRYFRWRAYLVVAYLAVVLATVIAWWPSSGNALHARVQVIPAPLMGTELSIRNDSDRDWHQITFTLDGGAYSHVEALIRHGDEPKALQVRDFVQVVRGRQRHAAKDYRPHTLTITCQEGRARLDLDASDE